MKIKGVGLIVHSIRGRIIAVVVLLLALLMGLLVADMLTRQKEFMQRQLAAEGSSLAHTLAVNAPSWLISNDVAGLDELVDSLKSLPNLALAMIVDRQGRVRASSDPELFNLVLDDAASRHLLVDDGPRQLWHDGMVDSAAEIVAGEKKPIGYARVILNTASVQAELDAVTRQGMAYTLFAILCGGLVVWLVVRTMTERLARLSRAAHEIAAGNLAVVLASDASPDEVGSLTEDFNQMAQALVANQASQARAAEQISRLNAELEARVHERTAQLEAANDALTQAKELAENASRTKSAFLANMSHEIRTPMNGIVGMANILRREGVTPKQAERIDIINTSAQHLLSIINDILDLSKIEAGKFELEETPLVVSSLLANVSSILSERARAKGLQLRIETGPLPPNLLGDPTRLQQALLNYATNAIKFTDKGSVTLRTLAQEESADAVRVRFEVDDTGIGIAPAAISRLFNAFEQADSTTTRKYGGTGLGLAITRRLAELMGGEAGADSTPGVGSTFWFTVQLRKGETSSAPEASANAEEAETVLLRDYAGCRILLAEDEPVNRAIGQMLLSDVGLAVDVAEDGVEAVELARRNRYDLILMDMQMPNLDGLDATRQIRQLPQGDSIPILAMTANAFAEDKARCFASGMNDFITKPVIAELLFETLLKWLEKARGKGAP
jgi:signal transduction histidine kinase/ActR/RegA family two-component response regulator